MHRPEGWKTVAQWAPCYEPLADRGIAVNQMELSPRLLVAAQALLDRHQIASPREISPLLGEGRCRLYRVRSSEGRLLLKQSTPGAGTSRDRIAAEFRFCEFLHRAGLRQMPEPIAVDEREGLALYEHVDGRPLRRAEIGKAEVEAAMDFVKEINLHRHRSDARDLEHAENAVFSVARHIEQVDLRVQRLCDLEPKNAELQAVMSFAREELSAAWRQTADGVAGECARIGIDLDAQLTPDRRVLSPAEIGFHNALRGRDGRIRFLELDSAGWDDPARLVGDFSDHPALPVSAEILEAFRVQVFADFENRQFEIRRSQILSPLFGARRCCRVLEDFASNARSEQKEPHPRSDILTSVNPLAAARLILKRSTSPSPVHPAAGQ